MHKSSRLPCCCFMGHVLCSLMFLSKESPHRNGVFLPFSGGTHSDLGPQLDQLNIGCPLLGLNQQHHSLLFLFQEICNCCVGAFLGQGETPSALSRDESPGSLILCISVVCLIKFGSQFSFFPLQGLNGGLSLSMSLKITTYQFPSLIPEYYTTL